MLQEKEMIVSGQELLRLLAEDALSQQKQDIFAETYGSYKDVHKEYITSIKHMLIAYVLCAIVEINGIKELGAFGAKLATEIIPLAALGFFSYSIAVLTNQDLKIRAYRAVYTHVLESQEPQARLFTVMKYPLAFFGSHFHHYYLIHKTHTLRNRAILAMLPLVAIGFLGPKVVFALILTMTGNIILQVHELPESYSGIKHAVLFIFFSTIVFSFFLRLNGRRKYFRRDEVP